MIRRLAFAKAVRQAAPDIVNALPVVPALAICPAPMSLPEFIVGSNAAAGLSVALILNHSVASFLNQRLNPEKVLKFSDKLSILQVVDNFQHF